MTIFQWKTPPELLEQVRSNVENQQNALDSVPKDINLLLKIFEHQGFQADYDMFHRLLRPMVEHSILNVFEHTDSKSVPEKVFLNTLLFVSILECPFGLIVTSPLTSNERELLKQRYRKNSKLWHDDKKQRQIVERKRQKFLSLSQERNNKTFATKKLEDFITEFVLEDYRLNAYHCTPQAEFPEILIDGESIRADILIWKPDDDSVKLVVECDGYDTHHDPNEDRLKHFKTFIKDRKRDRKLQDLGYCVRRYSGTEINKTPFECAADLITFLQRNPVLLFSERD